MNISCIVSSIITIITPLATTFFKLKNPTFQRSPPQVCICILLLSADNLSSTVLAGARVTLVLGTVFPRFFRGTFARFWLVVVVDGSLGGSIFPLSFSPVFINNIYLNIIWLALFGDVLNFLIHLLKL